MSVKESLEQLEVIILEAVEKEPFNKIPVNLILQIINNIKEVKNEAEKIDQMAGEMTQYSRNQIREAKAKKEYYELVREIEIEEAKYLGLSERKDS